MENNAFTEVCAPFVVIFYLSFIYLSSQCLLHPTVGPAQRCEPSFHKEKAKLLTRCCNTVFISNTVLTNLSVSKSTWSSLTAYTVLFIFI